MIVAQNLSKRFGKVVAVDSVNFQIPRGRVVGFLGPNGAGKTTTIRMIAGYLPPSGGSVLVDSTDVMKKPLLVRRKIGYLPESSPLYGEMRVGEYLLFRARLVGMARARRATAIEGVLRRCWLMEVRRRPIRHLSKGYRQRVGLAAALLHKPPVLILDEPTIGLDPAQIREVRSLIRELAGRHTVLLSTHILPEAELTCDQIIMIVAGRIRAQGTIDELRTTATRRVRYIVETDSTDAADVLGMMKEVSSIEPVKIDENWNRLLISPQAGSDDLRDRIGRALAQRGAAVREITRQAPTLEQLYVQIVAGFDAAGPKPRKRDQRPDS